MERIIVNSNDTVNRTRNGCSYTLIIHEIFNVFTLNFMCTILIAAKIHYCVEQQCSNYKNDIMMMYYFFLYICINRIA